MHCMHSLQEQNNKTQKQSQNMGVRFMFLTWKIEGNFKLLARISMSISYQNSEMLRLLMYTWAYVAQLKMLPQITIKIKNTKIECLKYSSCLVKKTTIYLCVRKDTSFFCKLQKSNSNCFNNNNKKNLLTCNIKY